MALSALDDRTAPPTAESLGSVLGRASAAWADLVAHLATAHGPVTQEWRFTSPKNGWTLKVAGPKRTLLYLIPCRGHFLAGIVLGEKAVAAARASNLPAAVIAAIEAARPYAEGRGIRLEVRTLKDVQPFKDMLRMKMG